jgi:hypothetical protein
MRVIDLTGPLFTEAERDWHRTTQSLLHAEATSCGETVEIL